MANWKAGNIEVEGPALSDKELERAVRVQVLVTEWMDSRYPGGAKKAGMPDGWTPWEPLPGEITLCIRAKFKRGAIIDVRVETWQQVRKS